MANKLHKDLTGNDLHGSKIERVVSSPIGNKLPPSVDYAVIDNDSTVYVSVGTGQNDWELIRARSNSNQVSYGIISVQDELDILQREKTTSVNINSVIPNNVNIGSFNIGEARAAIWEIWLQEVATTNTYEATVKGLHNTITSGTIQVFNKITCPVLDQEATWENPAGLIKLSFSTNISGGVMNLLISADVSLNITCKQTLVK